MNNQPDSNEIRNRCTDITNQIKSLRKDLDEIRSECKHLEYEVKNCSESGTKFELKKICLVCLKEIGYPSENEINDWAER